MLSNCYYNHEPFLHHYPDLAKLAIEAKFLTTGNNPTIPKPPSITTSFIEGLKLFIFSQTFIKKQRFDFRLI